jgi:CubicO group peptidase (beta-lactamase class C family)
VAHNYIEMTAMNPFTATLIVAVLLLSSPAIAEPTLRFDELTALIESTKAATAHRSGTAVAVVKDGKVIYEGYFGLSDIAGEAPVTRDTVFYIASTTKPFLALNVLLQEAAGRLDTRASLQQMFPDLHFDGLDARSVTVKDLLTHASGIDNQPLVWATAFSGLHDADTRRSLVAASYPLEAAVPGTFKYTNVGYNIVGEWLDQTLATPWQQQLDKTIFEPLGMTRTSALVSEAESEGWTMAKPYSFASADPNQSLYLSKSDQTMHAAGGLVSTAPDLAKFLISQLGAGRHEGRQVFPAALIRQSHLAQVTTNDEYLDFARSGYAWGWYTGEYKRQPMLHHFGSFAGFHAHLSFMPGKNIGLVVLNNEDFLAGRLTSAIASHVYGALLDEPDMLSKSSARFDRLLEQASEARLAAAKHRQAVQGRVRHLSQPPQKYVGSYSSDLLGTMLVDLDDDSELRIRWGRLVAIASGYELEDQVRVEFSPHSGKALSFLVKDGNVKAISFNQVTFRKAD